MTIAAKRNGIPFNYVLCIIARFSISFNSQNYPGCCYVLATSLEEGRGYISLLVYSTFLDHILSIFFSDTEFECYVLWIILDPSAFWSLEVAH